jgi:hypothetical protein
MTQEEIQERFKATARQALDDGATETEVADALLATGLSIAEVVAGPLAVARRLYYWALAFARQAGIAPEVFIRETRH